MPLPHFDTNDGANMFWAMEPPAKVHSVSATIPDQPQYHPHYRPEQAYASGSFSGVHPDPSFQVLQAASTLFQNAQVPQYNGTPYGSHSASSSGPTPFVPNGSEYSTIPRVPTSRGHLDESIAALLPQHSISGTVDASIAAEFSQVQDQHAFRVAQIHGHRPLMKPPISFGSDHAFKSLGYVPAPQLQTEADVSERLMNQVLHIAQPTGEDAASTAGNTEPSTPIDCKLILGNGRRDIGSDDDARSENEAYGEGSADRNSRPMKRRRKSKPRSPTGVKTEKGKGVLGPRPTKVRKVSIDDSAKKRRSSAQAQRNQRENLTEEQKRENHILSEQKRRNLIKSLFDHIDTLVPKLRGNQNSKSTQLTEVANFLENLVSDNQKYAQILASSGG